jgi:hypothetical protein
VRQLQLEVEWALEIAGNSPLGLKVMPPGPGQSLDMHPCAHCGREHTAAELDARAELQSDAERDRDECAVAGAANASILEPAPDVVARQIRGHQDPPCIACRWADEAIANVDIRIRGPVSVISMLHGMVDQYRKASEPAWRGFERALRHAEAQWNAQPKHRNPIYARDGWRCTAPACSSRRNLEDHHVLFRSRGGSDAYANRTTVCAWHHHRGIHAGRVRVTGTATGGLLWELGLRRDGPSLMTLLGDVYVKEDHLRVATATGR